jgi:hypothetical protein
MKWHTVKGSPCDKKISHNPSEHEQKHFQPSKVLSCAQIALKLVQPVEILVISPLGSL